MKFKNGMEVEVCSNEPGFTGAWFEGVVVSHGAGFCKVQYDKFETDEGHPLIEYIDCRQIRLRPPKLNITEWAVGDEIEVLDKDCWWNGVVTKILPDKCYSVSFPGYGTIITYHQSSIRSKQEWQKGKWSRPSSSSLQARKWDTLKRRHASEENTHEVYEGFHASEENTHEVYEGFPYEECREVRKFRCSQLTQDIDGIQRKDPEETKNSLELHARGIFFDASQMETDNKECSVSTTGSHTAFALTFQDKSANMLDKIESTHVVTNEQSTHIKNQRQNEIDSADKHLISIHKLELSAYCSVLQAFHAQGSLSWERESLLTNLRLELHISCQEHTFLLEQLSHN